MLKEIKIKDVNELNVMAKFGSNEPLLDMEVSLYNLVEPSEYHKLMKSNNVKIVYEVEDEILDEEEKEYLGNLIRPFRDRIDSITKNANVFDDDCYIEISLDNETDSMTLPNFEKDEMYLGMEEDKEYSLEELGL